MNIIVELKISADNIFTEICNVGTETFSHLDSSCSLLLLQLVILECSLDGILSQHGAVKLHRGEGELLKN